VYVPSGLITIVPLSGASIGVVFTTKFPSTSLSPVSVKSPEVGVFTPTDMFSLSTIGASLIGSTVISIVATFEMSPSLSSTV